MGLCVFGFQITRHCKLSHPAHMEQMSPCFDLVHVTLLAELYVSSNLQSTIFFGGVYSKTGSRLDYTGPAIVIAPHLQVATNVLRRLCTQLPVRITAQKGRGPGCASQCLQCILLHAH